MFPVQTGELLPVAVTVGVGFTITEVVAAALVHPAAVAVTE